MIATRKVKIVIVHSLKQQLRKQLHKHEHQEFPTEYPNYKWITNIPLIRIRQSALYLYITQNLK